MGKKLGQPSSKVSNKNEKQQFNNWIKVLRPKVYITDTSSFKRLVQELTGNPTTISKLQTLEISTSKHQKHQPQSSFDSSFVSFPEEELNDESYDQLIYLDDLLWNMNEEGDYKSACEDLESFLPDIDRNIPFYGCQILQEVSIYDYELSGVL